MLGKRKLKLEREREKKKVKKNGFSLQISS
jgi:hypothetical protein